MQVYISYKNKVKSKVVWNGRDIRDTIRKSRPLSENGRKKWYLNDGDWDLLDHAPIDGYDDEAFELAIDGTVE